VDPYAHPDYAALMAGVCADSDDDARRLVFADWFDEHGEPDRAEFIRLQIALAQKPPRTRDAVARAAAASASRKAARKRSPALLARHGKWWGRTLGPAYDVEYERGFAEGVSLKAADCLEAPPAVLAAAPVRALYVNTGYTEELSYLVVEYLEREKVWERLTRLHVTLGGLIDEQIVSLNEFQVFWRVMRAEVTVWAGERGRLLEQPAVEELRRRFQSKIRVNHYGSA